MFVLKKKLINYTYFWPAFLFSFSLENLPWNLEVWKVCQNMTTTTTIRMMTIMTGSTIQPGINWKKDTMAERLPTRKLWLFIMASRITHELQKKVRYMFNILGFDFRDMKPSMYYIFFTRIETIVFIFIIDAIKVIRLWPSILHILADMWYLVYINYYTNLYLWCLSCFFLLFYSMLFYYLIELLDTGRQQHLINQYLYSLCQQ